MENITIIKTTVIVNKVEFLAELKILAERVQKNIPSAFAINLVTLKQELGVKLTPLQFAELSNDLGFKLFLGKSIKIVDILNK